MAELATIARPYAEALFKACRTDLAVTAAWLDELAAIAANDQLLEFAHGPKVTAQQTFDVVAGVAKTALPEKARNFLRVLIDNNRLSALPEIAVQFRALMMRRWLSWLRRWNSALNASSTCRSKSSRR
jgi:F-type H+-transporting ATPase subunit delta